MADKYLGLPGASGHYASAPDAAELDVISDIEIMARIRPFDLTPTSDRAIVGKWSGSEQSYSLEINATTGYLRFRWSEDGFATLSISSTASLGSAGFSDRDAFWVRVTMDVDDGGGNREHKFYTSPDGASPVWTQLGSTKLTAGTTSIHAGTAVIEVGSTGVGGAQNFKGGIYRAQVYNGIGGTLVFDADFTDLTKAGTDLQTWTDSSAYTATITLNGDKWTYVRPLDPATYPVLTTADGLWRADDGNGLYGPNLRNPWADQSGQANPAILGDGAGADMPRFVDHDGTSNYVYLPGIAGNYLSTPDAAVLDITGDLEIIARVSFADLTPVELVIPVGKWNTTGNQRAYYLALNTTGVLRLQWSTTGATEGVAESTATLGSAGFSDGDSLWIRATIDVNDGGGNRVIKFYTSADGVTPSWSQLGTTVTTAGVITIYASTANLRLGDENGVGSAGMMLGKLYDVQIYDGIGGTKVFHFNAGDMSVPFATVRDRANGATITVERVVTSFATTLVDRAAWLYGDSAYHYLTDNDDLWDIAAGEDITVVTVARTHTMKPGHTGRFWYKREGTGAGAVGYGTFLSGTTNLLGVHMNNGTSQITAENTPQTQNNQVFVAAFVLQNDGSLTSYENGVVTRSIQDYLTGGIANARPVWFGWQEHSVSQVNYQYVGEIFLMAAWKSALTADQITALVTELGLAPIGRPSFSSLRSRRPTF